MVNLHPNTRTQISEHSFLCKLSTKVHPVLRRSCAYPFHLHPGMTVPQAGAHDPVRKMSVAVLSVFLQFMMPCLI